MLNKRFLWVFGLTVAGLLMVAGNNRPYRWWPINDMTEQPIIKPFHENAMIAPPDGAIAVDQWEPAPDRLQFMTGQTDMVNPIEATPESVAEGKHLFEIYCISCHGREMNNAPEFQSPVQAKGMPGLSIQTITAARRNDGYLYATLSNGSAIMQRYSFHLSPDERWHVINYMRDLQQQLAN